MDARVEKQDPYNDTEDQVVPHFVDIELAEQNHQQEDTGYDGQNLEADVGRVEERDDQNTS